MVHSSLSELGPRQLADCFESDVFGVAGDTWARDTQLRWPQGAGGHTWSFRCQACCETLG